MSLDLSARGGAATAGGGSEARKTTHRPLHFEARRRFLVPPERLWPLVSDTQRLNQVLKLPVIRFTTEPLATGGARVIGSHPIGSAVVSLLGQIFPLDPRLVANDALLRRLPQFPVVRWVEHPFEWEAPRRYAVLREYFWTPLGLFPFLSFKGGVQLIPTEGGGTEVVAFADASPRNPQGALLTRLVLGPKNVHAVIQQCRTFEQYLLGRIDQPFPQLARRPRHDRSDAPTTANSLARGGAAVARGLVPRQGKGPEAMTTPAPQPAEGETSASWHTLSTAGVAPELIAHLRHHLMEAPDEDCLKMRPFELAGRWETDRRETLIMFLHATTAGLVEMSWDVLCPNCRIAKAAVPSLAALAGQAHCEFCNITFDAAFDEQVEVRFTASERLRHIEERRFCSGGPMNTPHILAQATVPPGETRLLALGLAPGKYRLRSPQCQATAVARVAEPGGATEHHADFDVAAGAIAPALAAVSADQDGVVEIRIQNRATADALVALEKPEWPDDAATAAVVGTIQEFRDLFGSEALAPGLQLAIQRLAFLFTDLTGSTALYQAIGQARAFRLVQDHFALLGGAIEEHHGALIKTIGDAIMATFPSGADALRAALAMQSAMRRLDTGDTGTRVDPTRLLKIGVHEGPCIAVGANGHLDYFGTTINVAARVNHESRGGEICCTSDVLSDPAAHAVIQAAALPLEQSEVQLRGVHEPVRLCRLNAAPLDVLPVVTPKALTSS